MGGGSVLGLCLADLRLLPGDLYRAAIVVIYVAFLNSTTAWLISSARGTAGAVLVLGIVGGCGMSAVAEQYQGKQAWAYTSFASVLGGTALVAGVIALITASTVALAILVVATLVLWLVQRRGTLSSRPLFQAGAVTHIRSSIRKKPGIDRGELVDSDQRVHAVPVQVRAWCTIEITSAMLIGTASAVAMFMPTMCLVVEIPSK
jgi:hypothetical protein